jgi:polyisoprenoid-binding protein YceI
MLPLLLAATLAAAPVSIPSTAPPAASAFVQAPAAPAPTIPGLALRTSVVPADTLLLTVAEEGNRARYRVREQLARLEFPNDAVGETGSISGSLLVTSDGEILREGSRFVIRLADLESDSDRRDNYLRRNTLATDEYPDAVFVPTGLRELPSPIPTSGEARFLLDGDLTIRDVTRPVTWRVGAEFAGGAVIGRAETTFTFDEMGLTVPRVGSVLSIREDIRLEFDFRLVPLGITGAGEAAAGAAGAVEAGEVEAGRTP